MLKIPGDLPADFYDPCADLIREKSEASFSHFHDSRQIFFFFRDDWTRDESFFSILPRGDTGCSFLGMNKSSRKDFERTILILPERIEQFISYSYICQDLSISV